MEVIMSHTYYQVIIEGAGKLYEKFYLTATAQKAADAARKWIAASGDSTANVVSVFRRCDGEWE